MIKDIAVSSVINSKRQKSLKLEMKTDKGIFSASIPSGTSTGEHEAVEFSVDMVKKCLPKLKTFFIGEEESDIDNLLLKIDDSNFQKIGGNFALAMSLCSARSKTKNNLWEITKSKTFPIHLTNMVGGGRHGGNTDFQEFLLFPKRAGAPSDSYKQVLEAYREIGSVLKRKNLFLGKNRECAWISKLDDIQTLDLLSKFSDNFNIGIDCASSSLWKSKYVYKNRALSTEKQIDFLLDIIKTYKISYLEDPFHEEDFESFSLLTKKIGKRCLIVGDDLYCTNPDRLKIGIKKESTNGIIIKPNQIGTLLKTKETVDLAKKNKMATISSHRSRETADTWLADLSIAFGSDLIKIGVEGFDKLKTDRLIYIWNKHVS